MTPDFPLLGRISRLPYYDTLMKLPILVFTGYFILRETRALGDFFVPYPEADLTFWLNLASRVSILSFLALLALFHATRRRPVARAAGWFPRAVAFLGLTLPNLLFFMPRAAPDPAYDSIAVILILLGDYFSIVSLLHLGRSLSIMPEARKLVTSGPYGLVRHPLYLAEALAIVGVFLQFRSWGAGLILATQVIFQVGRMVYEEQVLRGAFPEYRDYAERVPRLVPKLQSLGGLGLSWQVATALLGIVVGGTALGFVGLRGQPHYPVAQMVLPPNIDYTVIQRPRNNGKDCEAANQLVADNLMKQCPACSVKATSCPGELGRWTQAFEPVPLDDFSVSLKNLRIVIAGEPALAQAVCTGVADQFRTMEGRCWPKAP